MDDDMRYISRVGRGFRLRLTSDLTHYFGDARYGSAEHALLAAQATREHFIETGLWKIPTPTHISKAEERRRSIAHEE